jgi:hypothetical protein
MKYVPDARISRSANAMDLSAKASQRHGRIGSIAANRFFDAFQKDRAAFIAAFF